MSEALQDKLQQALQAAHVEIEDNSWIHAGHEGNPHSNASGTHIAVTIVSPVFEDLSLLDRHRMVHKLLKEEFAANLHALELKTFSPSEWTRESG